MIETTVIRAGYTLTITADSRAAGNYYRLTDGTGVPETPVVFAAGSTTTIGPFATDRTYAISAQLGSVTLALAPAVPATEGDIDDFSGLATSFNTVPAARSVTVSENEELAIFGTFTVLGTVTIGGEVRIGGWPF